MIKTLQISSILAVILAAVLFVSSVVFGTAHENDQIEEYLKSPSVKDQFETLGSAAKKRSKAQTSPLVSKAELFARILNPPKPKAPTRVIPKVDDKEPAIPTPLVSKPKFRLFGTVECKSDPTKSLALLDEPGKGLLFVRQGAKIMHLTIELVKDGRIVVRDGTGTSEMVVEEGPAPASIVPGPPTAAAIGGRPTVLPAMGKTGKAAPPRASVPPRSSSGSGRRGPSTPTSARSRMTADENARLAALGDRLKAAKDAKAGKVAEKTEAEEDAEAAAMFKKLAGSMKEDAANKAATPSKSPIRRPVPPRR